MRCSCHDSTSLSLPMHHEQNASQFVRCIYGNSNISSLQRGVRHDQRVFVIWAFVTTWRAPPKIVGVVRGGGGKTSSYIHRMSVSLFQP